MTYQFMRKLTIKSLYFGVYILMSLLILYLIGRFFFSDIVIFNHARAQRYFDINVQKNWGWRKSTLQVAGFINSKLYNPQILNINIDLNKPGVSTALPEETFIFDNIEFANNEDEIMMHLKTVKAGTAIIVNPGTYNFNQRKLSIGNSGSKDKKIALMALKFGEVTFNLNSLEGIYIDKSFWVIKNINFFGVCEEHHQCEHAIHIVAGGDGAYIYNNIFKNFNAHIKVNGRKIENRSGYVVTNDVKIINNTFYNDSYRDVTSPVTPIDIVGGSRHIIRDNLITDFSRKVTLFKTEWSYGAFIKGESDNGKFENNLVVCSHFVPYQSALDARVGLSFGGGGTGDSYCPSGKCEYENINGSLIGNVIVNCINDASIFINKSIDTYYRNNTIINGLGMQEK